MELNNAFKLLIKNYSFYLYYNSLEIENKCKSCVLQGIQMIVSGILYTTNMIIFVAIECNE